MTVSRRQANKEKCRKQILKASRRLFKEKGYEATMIEDVAEKAEISKGTLYNYFPNKESLLVGTMEEETEAIRSFIEENLKDVADSEMKIRRTMTFLITDSIPFIGVSRRILFLNACPNSHMYGKGNDIRTIFAEMTEQAKQEHIFKEEIKTEEIVDLLMSVYLVSQFQWTDIEDMTYHECSDRVEHMISMILSDCYKEKR